MISQIRKPHKHWEFEILISKIFSKLHKYNPNTEQYTDISFLITRPRNWNLLGIALFSDRGMDKKIYSSRGVCIGIIEENGSVYSPHLRNIL